MGARARAPRAPTLTDTAAAGRCEPESGARRPLEGPAQNMPQGEWHSNSVARAGRLLSARPGPPLTRAPEELSALSWPASRLLGGAMF